MTFFSGTDTNTLQSEGNKRNHFVSLIVNNAGTYTAGITRKVNVERQFVDKASYRSYEDTFVKLPESEEKTESLDTIEWIEFDIEREDVHSDFSELDLRMRAIKETKSKPPKNTYTDYPKSPVTPSKQFSLFDHIESGRWRESPFADETDLSILARSYVKQLVTGAVTLADESRIDINKWIKGMDRLFDKRFPDIKAYRVWAESFCEFLVLYPAKGYEHWDEFSYAECLAWALIEELETLGNNKYIDILKEVLSQWTQR